MTALPKEPEAFVTDEAILHIFATADGDAPHTPAGIVPARRPRQEQYMLNVARGLLALQRLDLRKLEPLSSEEYASCLQFIGDASGARRDAMIGGAVMKALLRKWGVA